MHCPQLFIAGYRKHVSSGFLLLELALAMLLISIALVGLLDAYRATIEAHRSTTRRQQMRFLVEQKLGALEREGEYRKGVQEGKFEGREQWQWKVETSETALASLYRINVTISGYGESLAATVYLNKAAPEGA